MKFRLEICIFGTEENEGMAETENIIIKDTLDGLGADAPDFVTIKTSNL